MLSSQGPVRLGVPRARMQVKTLLVYTAYRTVPFLIPLVILKVTDLFQDISKHGFSIGCSTAYDFILSVCVPVAITNNVT